MTDAPHAYCTYFDSGYLSRGLTLIESLRAHGDHSPVWVMALDEATAAYLKDAAIPGVHVMTVADLEQSIDALAPLKSQRSRMEYYFTTTPLLIRWVMAQYADTATSVIYLDSDLYFFDDPQAVLDAMGDGSVGIIEHRYQPRLAKRLAKYGRFNVGWVGFRADARGKACLDWWGDRTLEWCRDVPDSGRYADQGYLDQFPTLFEGVAILESPGLNLAPWNTARHRIEGSGDRVTVDGSPLVFFHFHGLKRTTSWWVSSQLVYGARMGAALRNLVYVPYIRHLERMNAIVAASPLIPHTSVAARGAGLRGLLFRAQRAALTSLSVVTRAAVRAND
ncbi:hypothetical protein BH10ACT7_BH10ACT7_11290 [soil metagenome]